MGRLRSKPFSCAEECALLLRPQHAALILLLANPLFGQSSDSNSGTSEQPSKSVAEVAREGQTKKTKAKSVITDEDMDLLRGPFPRLSLEGLDNSDRIVRAIQEFARKHKPEETEQAVHDWYDWYDSILEATIRENVEIRELLDDNSFHGYTICQEAGDYRSCAQRRQMELRSAHEDQKKLRENGMLIGRIQQAFMRIRPCLMQYGLKYDWFKIRNGNNNGSF